MRKRLLRSFSYPVLAVLVGSVVLSSCGGSASASPSGVVEAYAEGVYSAYKKSLESAELTNEAIKTFVATPNEDNLRKAKLSWLAARDDYGRTEGFRFYDGPIDNEENGPEGRINAWPLDEAYIDYVQGNANAGIINNPTTYPTITTEVLTSLNEKDGETNISTGWHAIEYLLWGQDLSETSPGVRPATDYTTAANAERRKTYLKLTSELLVADLTEVTEAWAPGEAGNYRADFLKVDSKEALRRLITGIGELSRGELAGERLSPAFLNRSQEDEHSCFSDNTTSDVIANADSIHMVVVGDYQDGEERLGLADLVATKDKELANKLRDQTAESVRLARSIPTPFDKSLRAGVEDTDPGRVAISNTMKALEEQTDTIVEAAKELGITISVS